MFLTGLIDPMGAGMLDRIIRLDPGEIMGFLRVFLAVAVVAGHSGPLFGIPLVSGRTAVQCFFVISGFYMAMVLESKYLKLPDKVWATFMQSRLARLFPVYLLTAALTMGLLLLGGNIFVGDDPQRLPEFFSLPLATWLPMALSNLIIVTQDWALFAGVDSGGQLFYTPDFRSVDVPAYKYFLIPQAWTVGLELVFYASAPFIARCCNRTLFALMAGSIGLRIGLGFAGMSADPWSYRFFPFELSLFIAGMLAFRYRHSLVGKLPTSVPLVLVFVGLLLLPLGRAVPPAYAVALVVFPLVFALFVPAIFESTKQSAVDRWVGELSYPVYLVHILMISVFASVGLPLGGPAAVVLSLTAGAVVVVLVDRPLEYARQRRLRTVLARGVSPRREVQRARA
ncbi:acyltransferase family protein [Specibacter sp. NPDC057265]|uniref:acyltransferase family protein n=1 Tax=Specibacter sp. NPDC057265 TaxID=3346075 RepID=UPI003643FEAE